jgi:hypothetical protein
MLWPGGRSGTPRADAAVAAVRAVIRTADQNENERRQSKRHNRGVDTLAEGYNHPVWSHDVLRHPLYASFAERVQFRHAKAPESTQEQQLAAVAPTVPHDSGWGQS